jgi:hypothetical protein
MTEVTRTLEEIVRLARTGHLGHGTLEQIAALAENALQGLGEESEPRPEVVAPTPRVLLDHTQSTPRLVFPRRSA